MNNPASGEEKDIIEILELLQTSFKENDNKKLKEINKKLEVKFKDLHKGISLLFKALSLKSIKNNEIPLNVHISLIIYLKNILLNKQNDLDSNIIFSCVQALLELIFYQNKNNPNLNNSIIFNIINNIITNLSSSPKLVINNNNIRQSFKTILESANSAKNDNFLQIMKPAIVLCTSLLTSNGAINIFEELLNDYYIKIVNIIFKHTSNYIDPKNNIYNDEYICILKYLYEGFFLIMMKMRGIVEFEKRKEIGFKLFREYGLYGYELLQIMPLFNEATTKKYNNKNPIIVFNFDETKCYEINHMKSRILQFLSLTIQISTMEEKNLNENLNIINDNELLELVNKIIVLIINSFEDILNSQQKFIFIRRYNEDSNESDDCFNMLLFQMCIFLLRSLIREPIRSDFSKHIKKFLLNILFPLIITIDDEINFLEIDPEGYHQYIYDITNEFKIKNFRTCSCFLILRICEKYENMVNFILSFNIEMLKYILNEGKIGNELSEYNVYLKNKNDALINQFSDEIKLDFALLIILILKDDLHNNSIFLNQFAELLVNNQKKLHIIQSPIIKIKICLIYNYFSMDLFHNEKSMSKNTKIIENTINFLLNNIIQKKHQNEGDYIQALAFESSDTLIELLNFPTKDNEILIKFISENLEKNFSVFNKLIEIIDVVSFYSVLEQIISEIKIKQRDLLFECLNNISKKFQNYFLKNNKDKKIYGIQCFNIFRNFLTGKNKINNTDKHEIQKFNQIFEPLLNYIKNPKKFELYDELILTGEDYIKALNGINNFSTLILKNIQIIIDIEEILNSTCFSFVSTFLANIQNNISNQILNQTDLFNEILNIIKKSFTYNKESLESTKTYALLLTLQILDLNPNINEDILSFLLYNSYESYQITDEYTVISDIIYKINQISIANICLSFVFKPEITFNILNNQVIANENHSPQLSRFNQLINYIYFITNISYPYYNPMLGKCIILGICGILSDYFCMNFLDNNKKIKILLIKILIHFVMNHKNEKNLILKNIMKRELKCNFVEEEEDDDDDDYGEEIDFSFNSKIEMALSGNSIIQNSDEFKYFTQIMKYIKENDEEIYCSIINEEFDGNDKYINEIYNIRNIKINYRGKEFTVPRRTVKIIRNKNNK